MAGKRALNLIRMKNNYYQLDSNILVRLEYFGGLIVDFRTNYYYQIPTHDAIVLLCLKYNNDLKEIKRSIKDVFNISSNFNARNYEEYGFIAPSIKRDDDLIPILSLLKNNYDRCKKLNCLYAPISVTIYPTYACQAKCEFCYVRKYCDNKLEFMTFEQVCSIIDYCEQAKVPFVSLLGGEPLMLPYICDLLDYMGTKSIRFTVTTNAYLLNEEIANRIKKYKNIGLSISLQSVDGYHTNITGLDVERVINNIRKVGKYCKINTVWYKQSKKQLEELMIFLDKEQIKAASLSIYNNIYDDVDVQIKNFVDFGKIHDKLQQFIIDNGLDVYLRAEGCLQYLHYGKIKRVPKTGVEKIFSKCEAGQLKLEILPSGDVIGCTALHNDFISGNVFEKPMLNIWQYDNKLNHLRNVVIKDNKCKKCKYVNFCNGGCPAIRYIKNKNYEEERDLRCIVKK